MTFHSMIERIMPEVRSGSDEPFIIFREENDSWDYVFTKDYNGEPSELLEDIQAHDPYAVAFYGKYFSNGSYPYVIDKVLTARLQAEALEAQAGDFVYASEHHSLFLFFEKNISGLSSDVTDYLIDCRNPLAELYEIIPRHWRIVDLNEGHVAEDEQKAIAFIEDHVEERLNSQRKDRGDEGRQNDKRNIEGYEEKFSIQFASRYVVLAENPTAQEPYLVCNIRWDNPLGFEECYDGAVTNDYVDAMREFAKRLDTLAEALEVQLCESGLPVQTLTAADCLPGGHEVDWEGKVLIIRPEALSPEYRSAEQQLVLCTGGFGADPDASGRAVFVKELYSGKEYRYNRHEVAGLADPSKLPAWAMDKLALSRAPELDSKDIPSKIEAFQNEKPSLQKKLESAKTAIAKTDTQKDGGVGKTKKRDGRE